MPNEIPKESVNILKLNGVESLMDGFASVILMVGFYSIILTVLYIFVAFILVFTLRWRVSFSSFFTSSVLSLIIAPFIMIGLSTVIPPEKGFGMGIMIMLIVAQFSWLIYVFEPDDLNSLVSKNIIKMEKKKRNEFIKIYKGKINLIKTRQTSNEDEVKKNKEEIEYYKSLIKVKKMEFKRSLYEQGVSLFNRKKKISDDQVANKETEEK